MTTKTEASDNFTVNMNELFRSMALDHLKKMTKELRTGNTFHSASMQTMSYFWAGNEYSLALECARKVDDNDRTRQQVSNIMLHTFGKYNMLVGKASK